ncbi:MAG TPA: protein kinase [Pyrinomonadaceae bacterium]|nr:serine/threonine-protein kinase [Chloracidobacterium sp.]MBP9934786.1 serine/threonine-protein kinase [Pyrinomonadaceae bacterium]MBK9767572.1 serine/threonine-protein kinase [Chloracidobacterium sp.]MBL0240953.1 serine/threonine-protein kinase [Chloracidobacterium sp.]HQX56047.1 protein kinase [Pyrinomonadaceae bacterium]
MSQELKPDTELSHYRIVSKIGEGGMGEVYLAKDTKLDRRVAIKVLSGDAAGDDDRIRRFMLEAKAASALNHPNILTVFEMGTVDGLRYIATEFISGETLRDRLNREPMTLRETLDVGVQAAAALNAAHEAGIIHRDIKPENIMVRDDGLVKVLDFGLAKLTERTPATASSEDATRALVNTRSGMVLGTVSYMSPEQARGKETDARTDIWSLGVVLFEQLTGQCPFHGDGAMDIVSSILKDPTPVLRSMSPDLPRQLERIIDKTLRKDREQRYQHIKDLHIDLDDLRDELKFEAKLGQSVELTRPVAAAQNTGEGEAALTRNTSTLIFRERRFTLFHVLAIAAVAVILMGGIWWLRAGRSSTVPGSYKTTDVATWNSAPGELFSNASFSPDGKMIAFSSTRASGKNIWVTQTASTEAIQVTNDAFSNKDPIWSPKGDEIAFYSQKGNVNDSRGSVTGIWRVSALGGTPKSVGAVSDGNFELRRWAASGKVYYQSNADLFAIDVVSGEKQKVTTPDAQGGRVMWVSISPDEKSVGYAIQKDKSWQIFTADIAANTPTEVAAGTGEIDRIVWLAEKKRFLYSSLVEGVFQVFVVDSFQKPVRITSTETDSIIVDASADGGSVIVSSAKEESSVWRVTVADARETPISSSVNSELWPSVSPDDSRIVYQAAKNLSRGNNLFESAILVKKLNSRDDRPTTLAERGFLPDWSPDGTSIAFFRRDAENLNNIELMTANPNGGGAKQLTAGGIAAIGYSVSPYNHIQTNAFAWSPNSSAIAYVSDRNGSANVWKFDVRDGTDTQLTANTGKEYAFLCPIWSSDGKRLAYYSQKKNLNENQKTVRALNVVDVAAKSSVMVAENDQNFRLIGWTPDENGLIIAATDKMSGLPPETVLKRIDASNGAETVIGRFKNAYFYNIFLSGDRKLIAFAARNNDRDDIWVVSTSGGEPRKLTNNNDSGLNFSRLAWLHDGSSIVFGKQTRFSLLSMITDIK